MDKNEKFNRIRLLKIYDILKNNTDEEHPMGTEILRKELADLKVPCHRSTLYDDIKMLNEFGYEIMQKRARSNLYYVEDRNFSKAEVCILLDAIQASRFITSKKTSELTRKIANLAGVHKGEVLSKNIIHYNNPKSINEVIWYSVDAITTAIQNGKQIGFTYSDYNQYKDRIERLEKDSDEVKHYIVNPVATVFSDDNYYLFCYSDKYKTMTQYRVDRMNNVTVLDSDITKVEELENFDVSKYKSQLFGMYGGEVEDVYLKVKKPLYDLIFDKFGYNATFVRNVEDEDASIFKVTVRTNDLFVSWCISYGNKIEVDTPKSLRTRIKNYIEEQAKIYE